MPDINSLRQEIRQRLEMINDEKMGVRFSITYGLLELYGFPRTLEFLCEDPSIGEMDDEIKKTGGYDALKEWKKDYSTSELIEPLLFLIDGTNRIEDACEHPGYKIVAVDGFGLLN